MKSFEWENKKCGTFILCDERYFAYKDKYSGKIVFGRNYGSQYIIPLFTKHMSKTIKNHWNEIYETVLTLNN